MAVLMIADVPGQTREGYDGLLAQLGPRLRQAKGFIAHYSCDADGGWRCMELWETQEDATRFFATEVHPYLPAGVSPKRKLIELHSLVQPSAPVGAVAV
jgi:hypothetical protein